ncbi:AraC family transcriptional regulator [Pediococcus damnosus]|uniref:Transcriptional regulator of rhamnose utilization, AraC family n=1 Tax=Pediococcus damnosus TaxID=51663 RepID=A0AAC9B3G3_9LACO|nr:AraC family transcriptional regulator [Pediococcus damnosus]AMV63549.1 Transcriptional regulator of rhamnose utilization, AraC family [Pediococcus damnosus]
MSTIRLDPTLFALNNVEKSQLTNGENYNYMDLDFINNPIPRMPAWDFFKKGSIAVTKSNRFSYVPAHTHSFMELNYMYAGSCIQYINDEKIVLRQGNLLLLDKDIVQRIDYTGRDDILVNILIKSDADISALFHLIPESLNIVSRLIYNIANKNSLHNNFILFDLLPNDIALSLIDALIEKGLTKNASPQRNQSMELLMSALIIELKTAIVKSEINFSDSDMEGVLPIIRYVNANYATTSLATASHHFGYNGNYLSNKLKHATGKNFQELVDRRRLSVAENLIIKTDLSSSDICELIGYKNVTSLFRLFKKYLNSTPFQYRCKVHPKFTNIGDMGLPTKEDLYR